MSDVVRIRFEDVGVDFPTAHGPMRVVDGVSLDVRQGEFVSIIGPSGCGKTTLMNIVGGFVKPTRGLVLLDDEPITGPGPDRGVIFQEYGVFPWLTVRGNIEFGLQPARQRARTPAARRDRRALHGADGPDATSPTTIPKHLSGGMRQRLALARAYAVQPEFLLMDEPFGALDAQTRTAMQDLLLQVLRDRRQDGAADHPLGRRGDLPVVAHRRRHGAAGAGAHRSSTCRSPTRARSRCTRTRASPSCARTSASW